MQGTKLDPMTSEINMTMANEISRGMEDGSICPDLGDPFSVALSLWAQTSGLVQFCIHQEKSLLAGHGIAKATFLEEGILMMRRSIAHSLQGKRK
jgi:hypothetical protein